jgi:hypothetical protein
MLRVPPAGSEQLVVRAKLDDAPFLDNGDSIGALHRRKPMCDD